MARRVVGLGLLVAALAGCGDDATNGGRPSVVATTTEVADLARNVGGGRIELHTLLGHGADPHGYEPRPSDVREVAEAELVLRSGGEIDSWLEDLIDAGGGDAEVVVLDEAVAAREDDPHWWQDLRRAERAVEAISRSLAEIDPGGRAAYRRTAARYARRLRLLDRGVARCLALVPPARRALVTVHDALGYLADRYGLRVVGTLIPSRSTHAQASAGHIDRLVRTMRAQRVPAVFPERGGPTRLAHAVARQAAARLGDPLTTDSLGAGESYLEAMASNAESLVEGLTGGERSCTPGTRP